MYRLSARFSLATAKEPFFVETVGGIGRALVDIKFYSESMVRK